MIAMMMKTIVIFAMLSMPASANDSIANCDVNDLYERVKNTASSSMEMLASANIATYPDIEDVNVQQYGDACDFTFTFEMKTTSLGGQSFLRTRRFSVTKRYDFLEKELRPAYIFDMDR